MAKKGGKGGGKEGRSAITGKFVTKAYADKHKRTTVMETRRGGKPKGRGK